MIKVGHSRLTNPKEAVAYLKLYAQAGSNLMQVVRSLELIAQNDAN